MQVKEDLIGTEWKCPRCKSLETVTKDGIQHSCLGYYINKRLDMLWNDELAYEEFRKLERKLIYGTNN